MGKLISWIFGGLWSVFATISAFVVLVGLAFYYEQYQTILLVCACTMVPIAALATGVFVWQMRKDSGSSSPSPYGARKTKKRGGSGGYGPRG